MKVRIDLTIEVDAASWASTYGIEESEVRNDVKEAIKYYIYEHPSEAVEPVPARR